jgi:hypothetical protein
VHRFNARTEAAYQGGTFGTHPIGHENDHGVPKRASEGGKSNPGITARCLDNGIARTDVARPISLAKYVQRHAVLDAAREIEEFRFGENRVLAGIQTEFNRK